MQLCVQRLAQHDRLQSMPGGNNKKMLARMSQQTNPQTHLITIGPDGVL